MKQLLRKCCSAIGLFFLVTGCALAQANRAATDLLYKQWGDTCFWWGDGRNLRETILRLADSAAFYGLHRSDYAFPGIDTASPALASDHAFTRAAIALLSDMHQGSIVNYISNDEVAHGFRGHTDSFVVNWLLSSRKSPAAPHALVPAGSHSQLLGAALTLRGGTTGADTVRALAASANIYRWIGHFGFNRYIVVNIPSAMLTLYDHDTVRAHMKVVVGKPSTRTPRFSSWMDKVILYPYWNVPASIATRELLPAFKRSPAKVKEMNMEILDKSGRILNPYSVDWKSLSRGYFPYTIRQCTGCDNALGVMKFNLTDPFSVYMHDTNNKPAFMSDHRYLSHGCIRLSDPVTLGNALLNNKLDTAFLAACYKNEDPQEIKLAAPVPVFVVYMTAEVQTDSIRYHKDIYRLFR